jgi:hypothetical protein
MKKILFCPPLSIGNTIEERTIELMLGEAFEGNVTSFIHIQGYSDEELFNLICDTDLVIVMCDKEMMVGERTHQVVQVASQIGRPIYQVKQKEKKGRSKLVDIFCDIYFVLIIIVGSFTIAKNMSEFVTPVNKDSRIVMKRRRNFLFLLLCAYGLWQWWHF